MTYLHWNQITISDHSPQAVTGLYELGYVFTRLGKGIMQQTRSARVDLSAFDLSSENRRILKKTEGIMLQTVDLPLLSSGQNTYDWKLGKSAKDFYDDKFGPGIMSAQKIKEMLTSANDSNFNLLLRYTMGTESVGYSICYSNPQLLHYSYPFYDPSKAPNSIGLGMMIRAIQYAKSIGLKHIYIGSLQRPADTYKLQFEGLEWFDGGPEGSGTWTSDIERIKKALKESKMTLV